MLETQRNEPRGFHVSIGNLSFRYMRLVERSKGMLFAISPKNPFVEHFAERSNVLYAMYACVHVCSNGLCTVSCALISM